MTARRILYSLKYQTKPLITNVNSTFTILLYVKEYQHFPKTRPTRLPTFGLKTSLPKGSNQISSAVHHRLTQCELDGVTTVKLFSDGCGGQNKNKTMIAMLARWLLLEAPISIKKIILYFPIVGHSFIPPDRVFGNLERQFRAKSVIDNPNGYIAVIAEHCTIEHLGEGCPVQEWKLYGDEVLKQPSQWHFQFQKSKKIGFSRSKTRKLVMVQGEPFYGFECGEPKSLVKKGKTFSNARIPEVPRGVPIKLAKVNDVRSLLVLHYGEQWQDDPKLNFYTKVFLQLDSLQPDEGTDEGDILNDLEINPEDDHEVVA